MTVAVSFNIKVSSRDEILRRAPDSVTPSLRQSADWSPRLAPAQGRFAHFISAAVILKLQLVKIKHIPSGQIQEHTTLLSFNGPSIVTSELLANQIPSSGLLTNQRPHIM